MSPVPELPIFSARGRGAGRVARAALPSDTRTGISAKAELLSEDSVERNSLGRSWKRSDSRSDPEQRRIGEVKGVCPELKAFRLSHDGTSVF